jgi:hypothetical protein
MIATKKQMYEHYVAAGMPEIYAFMAVQEVGGNYLDTHVSETLLGAFIWRKSKLGFEFWDAVHSELEAIELFKLLTHFKY